MNLLTTQCRLEDLVEIVSRYPRKPLLPRIGTKDWNVVAKNSLAKKLLAPLNEWCARERGEPLPELTDELYGDFHKTGRRLPFENVYFERRRRLARSAVWLLVSPSEDPLRGKHEADLLEKFRDIFEEVSWALPASTGWKDNDHSGKEPMTIDLFCAETANLMAEMLDVFGEIIPTDLQGRIRERLHHAIFENYLQQDFFWPDSDHNWNAVCHQGVVGAALSQVDDPLLLAKILHRMSFKLPKFLGGFTADGGCSEGPGYWGYGFGWFSVLNEQLETRTQGELSLFEGNPHIREIALYGPRTVLAGGNLVNFSDCVPTGGQRHSLLYYLADRLREKDCLLSAQENLRRLVSEGVDWPGERTDVFYLLRTLLTCPPELPPSGSELTRDSFLPDLAVMVARGADADGNLWEFAAKGGNNGEHHNHNDCGSFLLNLNGVRVIREIGAPEYNKAFFGPERYSSLEARSLGHSVPLVNGFEQPPRSENAAEVLLATHGDDRVEYVLDLTKCYPAEAGCLKLIRTFVFEKLAGRLTVTDAFELKEAGEFESLIICRDPVVQPSGDLMIAGSEAGVLLCPDSTVRLAEIEMCAFHEHSGEADHIHRLRFTLREEPCSSGSLLLTFSLPPNSAS